MPPPRPIVVRFRRFALPALLLVLCGLGVGSLRAQQQESALLSRIVHPNMDLHYGGFDRAFDGKAATGNRQATVRSFAFGHAATMKTGDGAFHARNFASGKAGFRTDRYSTKSAALGDRNAASQGDRSFATRSVDVHDDRAAGKSSPVRQYATAEKPYLVPGKRQDDIDELRAQKNLTIDQVRELLNKNK